ncbi:8-oxoguanine deaminase [Clostridium tagluense]|uniref:8-oxoguanine deaminase n=1 Tax=Clostridium tagluense TaxID=360422 RepID=UPI001CF2B109|nr:8-oxoguanine deaminase [Clostridium tagluense]MCB2312458.1 8-oxoguanine deaminase [Clostridium tagluense]MCB2317133.1 8-oxoguanine deaminase [Clostridium tagluense]MCB2321997.1 8-oxoguanine deaminase [Clostridium tagluense]MCB2327006.1 8-oxoguanine deaminase [Clostridium tagluense]MCB2331724.1 8-oxoguanine deaminase [Clostridium tagluense]
MKNSIFLKNIKYLVTCDDNENLFENINMYIENGEIKYIGKSLKVADEIIDATDMVVYPGLINTHHHLYQIFSRNIPEVQNMELFPWLKYLYEIWKNVNSDVIMHSSLCGMGELLKTGCTTCFDHHYVFPKNQNNLIEAQFEAAQILGMRMYASRGSMSLSVKDGGLPPDTVVQSVDEILKDSERLVNRFHDKNRFSMRQVALAPCSPFSVTGTLMRESAVLARKLGVRLHTHLAETVDEENFTLEKFNMRPLEYMESLGWVGPDVWFAHGIHFNDDELKTLARTGTGVTHCPISNMKLSSGIAKIPQMLKLNVPVGLGVDGSASNDGSNMLEEMRVAFLLHRLNAGKSAPTGYDILKIATKGSARVLGRDDIGKLSVGMAADLFMINLNRLELVGAGLDPKALLSTVGFKGNVDYTIVNGKIVVKDGSLINIDEEKTYNESHAVAKKFIQGGMK